MTNKKRAEQPSRSELETAEAADPGAPTPPGPTGDLMAPEAVQALLGQRYRIGHVAGTGGMGQVFAATDTLLERRVAIKFMHRDAAGPQAQDVPDGAEHERVLAEARAMAGLRHPNLCRVHEVSLESPVPFIVMDWIDGIDLQTAWRGTEVNRRLPLFLKIVEAVAAAHAAGLVHRDLKPDNILVDRMGEPIIVDFGLARSQANGGHTTGGTPGYAAPEQFEPGEAIGATADVYALGTIMFEMLADRLPFAAPSVSELLRKVKEEDPPLPETYAPDVPWPLQRVCLVAVERDPSRRYPDAHAMALDLRRFLRGESVAARPSMLTERFADQVEHQIERVDSWRRQGLLTGREADRIDRVLSALLRPESHWILDGRRLSLSQVTLYLGGWFVLIALTIGMSLTWEALEPLGAMRYLGAWGLVVAFLGAGAFLRRRGEPRVALGYQMTACLAVPVAMWLTLWETDWLAGALTELGRVGIGEREWQVVFRGVGVDEQWPGLFNQQVLVIMLAWLGAAQGLRRFSASSAFTLWAVLAAALAAVAAWCSAGLLSSERESFAWLGLWVTLVGAAALYPGLRLNRREERYAKQYGLARAHARDAWPLLTGSVLMIGVGLTLMAWYGADVYTLTLLGSYDDPSVRAVAFMLNGCALQALSRLLGRQRTALRGRLAESIRWVSPSHFLASIFFLEWDVETGGAWVFWLFVLVAASIACCYVSVWRQWRPFLFTGLFYVAVAYFRAFVRLWDQLEGDALDAARLRLTGAVLVLGIATMVLAWRLPAWTAALKLGRWSRGKGR
jgi:serine/threonine protein kinase